MSHHGHSHSHSNGGHHGHNHAHGHDHGHSHGHQHSHGHSHGGDSDDDCCHHDHEHETLDDSDFNFSPEEQAQLLKDLAEHVPPEVKKLPPEQQKAYIENLLQQYQNHMKAQQQQKSSYDDYLALIKQKYKPGDADLLDISKWAFEPEFLDAVKSGSVEKMKSILTEVHPRIYAFPMLKPKFCERLINAVHHFEKWSEENKLSVHRPNSMNNYGAILDQFGYEAVLDQLMRQFVEPFSKFLYPHIHAPAIQAAKDSNKMSDSKDTAVAALDSHHGFVVEYQKGKDVKLDFHVDAADVTLNLCLGTEFSGGDLYFGGVRCAKHQQNNPVKQEEFYFKHRVGQGILHLGKHRHAATEITSGHRYNLILWCRSSAFHATRSGTGKDCPDWCWVNKLPNFSATSSSNSSDKKK